MSFCSMKFSDFITLQRGHDLTKEQFVKGEYPVVSSTTIMGYHNEYKAKGPGVVIGRSGTLGEVQYVCSNYWPHNTSLYVKEFKGNYPKFVYYFLKNFGTETSGGGSAVPTLNRNNLNILDICVPDLATQKSIADFLSTYDDLIENNQRQIKLLEEAAQRLYKEWFVDLRFPGHETTSIINGVPQGWKEGTIQDIVVYHDKKRKPLSGMQRAEMQGKFRYYGAASVLDYINNYLFDGTYLLLGEDGTVITEDGYPILQYVTGKFWVNNHAHVLTGNQDYPTEYLYMMFKVTKVRDVVTGVAQPKISQARLSNKKIIIPNKDIVRDYCSIVSPMFKRILSLELQIELFKEARDRLLPKLMSGELEVKN